MLRIVSKLFNFCFYLLFFITPLILFPKSSEIFEFNKMIATYLITILIICLWIIKTILTKKIIFKKTILDLPLIIFFTSQLLSTIFSIDGRTSIFGYYSRFHGGLLSTIAYLLLYWAYVSNMNIKSSKKSIFFILLSSFFVSTFAVFQHFGIDKNIWVQDVQTRVFSTLGQPNWLAAWVVAIIPLSWIILFEKAKKNNELKTILYLLLFIILLTTLIYTKSRSGFLGFATEILSFGFFLFVIFLRKTIPKQIIILRRYLIILFSAITIFLLLGTPWTTAATKYFKDNQNPQYSQPGKVQGPALEIGGTDSGKIRKIVWKGAIGIWKNYPILGSGVETFAFSYYQFKPLEHNLVSEWDFLYNKAHNEYLNFLATCGIVGLVSYITLILFIVIVFLKKIFVKTSKNIKGVKIVHKNVIFNIALLSGFLSILVTNFFGFSVSVIALLFFLFPAISFSLEEEIDNLNKDDINLRQKLKILGIILLSITMISKIVNYWLADFNYARSQISKDSEEYFEGQKYAFNSIKLSPHEPLYWNELSQINANLAVYYSENNNPQDAETISVSAISEAKNAIAMSGANVNLKRDLASIYIKLTAIDSNYIQDAIKTLNEAIIQAPTDAKLMYNLGLAYIRIGDLENAQKTFSDTIKIKENYRNAHFALGLVYYDLGQKDLAKKQMEYILININLNDIEAKKQLSDMK